MSTFPIVLLYRRESGDGTAPLLYWRGGYASLGNE
jgi:hypothetical protein